MRVRPSRRTAVVGVVVAAGAATAMGLTAGLASAQPDTTSPGRCTDNVNVRAEPSLTGRILSICETGTPVETGQTRNGFVQLVDRGGWAAQQYVRTEGRSESARPTPPQGAPTAERPDERRDAPSASRDAGPRSAPLSGADDPLRANPAREAEPTRERESAPGLLDGLLN